MSHGTWQTTGGGGNGLAALVAGAGIAAAGTGAVLFAEAVAELTWVIASVFVLTAAGIIALAIHGNRRAAIAVQAAPQHTLAAEPVQRIPARPAQAALTAAVQIHHHWHGVSPAEVAAILAATPRVIRHDQIRKENP